MPNALPALGNCSIWQVPQQIYREAQTENKYKNKRHKTLSNFTTVQNFLLHRVTNFQVRKRKLLNMQSMQQASKATKSPRGKKCLQFYTNSIFTVQSCGDKRKTNVRSRNCRHGKDTYLKCLKEVASKWKLFQLWITLKMKHILSFLWSHCLNKKVILNCLGNSRGLREAAFGQRACYDNEYPAITTTTTLTTTSLRWGRHGTFAFGRCRFGHLHMTASRRGRGGGRTSSCDAGVWEPQHFGALNGAASAARDLQRPPRYHNLFGHHVSREGPRRAHVLREIINGYNHELSQAPSRSCAPWPTVPHSPPLSLFLSVAWTFFHMQLQLISTA